MNLQISLLELGFGRQTKLISELKVQNIFYSQP